MNECFKRIILDIKDIKKDPIDGVHYFPCEENIMKGKALIFGPSGTPYEHGNFVFHFEFTNQYPYAPPIVTYETNNGMTRFNPNFYRNGKVCLSILNTWNGEQWSACQSIRSVLVTLQFTMNEYPLMNEPGIVWDMHYNHIHTYNQLIQYKSIETSIYGYLENKRSLSEEMYEVIKAHFLETKEQICETLRLLSEKYKQSVYIKTSIYQQEANLDYNGLYQKISMVNETFFDE
jgi:ubiquitin-conjugating enzyme E2 Z